MSEKYSPQEFKNILFLVFIAILFNGAKNWLQQGWDGNVTRYCTRRRVAQLFGVKMFGKAKTGSIVASGRKHLFTLAIYKSYRFWRIAARQTRSPE